MIQITNNPTRYVKVVGPFIYMLQIEEDNSVNLIRAKNSKAKASKGKLMFKGELSEFTRIMKAKDALSAFVKFLTPKKP